MKDKLAYKANYSWNVPVKDAMTGTRPLHNQECVSSKERSFLEDTSSYVKKLEVHMEYPGSQCEKNSARPSTKKKCEDDLLLIHFQGYCVSAW